MTLDKITEDCFMKKVKETKKSLLIDGEYELCTNLIVDEEQKVAAIGVETYKSGSPDSIYLLKNNSEPIEIIKKYGGSGGTLKPEKISTDGKILFYTYSYGKHKKCYLDDFVKSDGSRRGQYIEIHTSGPSVTLGKRMDFHGETEWIYNTPEKIREAKHINNLRIGFDIVDNPINPKLKRFKITKMENSSATSPEEFIAEIDEKSTSDDQLLIAHKIFTNIGYSNTWALYGGKIVPENILVDKSAGLIAYRTHLFTPVITPNLHHVDSIGEDVFLLKKEGDFLKGIHIIGGLTYYGDRMDRIKLGSFSDGGNILNYSVTKGKAYSKNKIETKHYQYNLTLDHIFPL